MRKEYKFCRVFVYAFILLSFTKCNNEIRTYKRIGGEHLKLNSGKNELFWFSGVHGTNPKNKMFNDISIEFNKFNPDVVLVEGNANYNTPADSLTAIKSGESSYVAFLANQKDIRCVSTEPTDSALNQYLLKRYSKEDILSMYIIRQMVQWQRGKLNASEIIVRITNFADEFCKDLGFPNEVFAEDEVLKILEPHTGINSENKESYVNFNAKEYIYFSENIINKIWQETADYRNIYLLQLIHKEFKTNDKIFIMMGFDHAKELQKELLEVVKN